MSKYKDFEFVRRCIRSCVTVSQIRAPITKLNRSFYLKHKDQGLWNILGKERADHFTMMLKNKLNITKIKENANRIYSGNTRGNSEDI